MTKKGFQDDMFFFNINITTYWIELGQLGLTCQIHYSGYETINRKQVKKKLYSLISNQPKVTQINLSNSFPETKITS